MVKKKQNLYKSKERVLYAFFLILGSFIGHNISKYSNGSPFKISNNDDIEIDIRFSPNGGCTDLTKNIINNAKKIILVQAYYFTSEILSKELINAYNKGIKVKILIDKSQLSHKYSKLIEFKKAGINIFIDKVHGLSHNKIMIIDDHYVLTGSFNWTKSAEKRNSENLLLIKSKKIAKIYKKNWYKRQSKAKMI